jgi:hypothetical protein
MAQPARVPANSPKKPLDSEEAESAAPQSRLSWLLGWVVTPTLFFGGIFLAGAYVGANHPDGWVTGSVRWVTGLF